MNVDNWNWAVWAIIVLNAIGMLGSVLMVVNARTQAQSRAGMLRILWGLLGLTLLYFAGLFA